MTTPLPLSDVLLRQSAAWQRGDRVRLEDLLARYPHLADDRNAVLDLIYNEVVLREAAGEKPALADYLGRFPHLGDDLRLQFEVDQALTIDNLAPTPASNGSNGRTTIHRGGTPPVHAPPDWLTGLQLLEEVGRGAMGSVWRAYQPTAKRVVAVKLLALDVPPGRVQTEVEAVTRLSHPNILPIFEVRQDEGRTALVLEYAHAGSLAKKLAGKPQPPRDAALLVETLASAMAHAHQRGVIHRDLKPSNVLLFGDADASLGQCVPRIGDFGLAKLMLSDHQLTRTNDVLGTPSYMAPEQTGGQNVGPLADVYALGAILYECLTGRPPFLGEGLLDTLEQLRKKDPVPPSQLQPRTPHDLEVICLKCLHKSPARRYATAQELAEDLRRFLAGEPVRARPVSLIEHVWKWSRRHPAAAALAAVTLVAALGFAIGGIVLNRTLLSQRNAARERAEIERQRADEREDQYRQARRVLYNTQLLRVGAAWPTDPQQALRMLEDPRACPPEMRCFSWGVLYSQCKRYRDDWPAHDGPVTALAVAADGTVATAGHDGKIRLWSADGQRIVTMHEHASRVGALAFSPDSQALASGGDDGMIKLWDLRQGRGRSTIRVGGQVSGLAFHPNGRQLISCGGTRGVGVLQSWDVRTLANRRVFSQEMHPLSGVAISPDGSLVACADASNYVRVFVTATGSQWVRMAGPGRSVPVTTLAFLHEGRRLLGGSLDGKVRLYDTELGKEEPIDVLDSGLGAVMSFAVHPRSECVALATMRHDETDGGPDLQLWHVPTGRLDEPVRTHDGGIGGLAFSPDGKSLYTAGRDRTVKVWDYPGRRESVQLRDALSRPGTVALSRDGHSLAWVRRDPPQGPGSMVAVYDLRNGELAAAVSGHDRSIRCLALSADGRTVAFSSGPDDLPAELLLFDTRTSRLVGVLTGHKAAVTALAAGPGPNDLASASLDGTVKVWDLRTGKERRSLSDDGVAWRSLAYADGAVAAGGARGKAGVVRVWDAGGKPLRRIETKTVPSCVALSPDGEVVAWAAGGGEVRLGGREEATLVTGMSEVAWLAFGRDGKTLAVAGSGTAVQLWDVPSAQERATLTGHRGGACCAAFAVDGRTLFTASATGQGRLWYSTGEARAK